MLLKKPHLSDNQPMSLCFHFKDELERLEFLQALLAWQKTNNQKCNCITHVDKPDALVCQRELLWRRYVEARNKALVTRF